MGSRTRLVKAGGVAKESLRTTVPIGIIEQFGLKAGDELDWEIEFINGKKIVLVKRVSGDGS